MTVLYKIQSEDHSRTPRVVVTSDFSSDWNE